MLCLGVLKGAVVASTAPFWIPNQLCLWPGVWAESHRD